jgi:hypothetical protein
MTSELNDGRHPVNVGHLVMGLAFAGLVGVWAVVQADLVADDDIRWLMPIPWVVAGAVGLLVSALAGRQRHTPSAEAGWVGDYDDTTFPTGYIPPRADPAGDTPPDDIPTDDIPTDDIPTGDTEENR